ncbi:MAG: oligosaccharide flippase family protein [Elusimicrobia bacterium]|nr:oligosaccharide flippase family protein [Elusimicrobiota bacterium]
MSISRNSIVTFAFQGWFFITTMLISIIVARALGPAGKGVYAFIFVVILTALDILRLNMDISSVYHIGMKKYNIGEILTIYFVLTIVLSIFTVGIYYIFSGPIHTYFLKDVDSDYLRIAIFSIPILLMNYYLSSALWGLNEIVKMNIVRVLRPLSFLIMIVFILLFMSKNILYFIMAYMVSFLLAVFCGLYFLRKHVGKISAKINVILLKSLIFYGFKGAPGQILTSILYRIGPYMVTYYLGVRSMGFYSIALYAELLWQIPYAINIALFPVLSSTEPEIKAGLTRDICRNSVFIAYCFAILLIIISKYLIKGFYGDVFSPAIIPFRILLVGTAAGSVTRVMRSYFYGIGKPEINTYVSIIVILVTPFLYMLFIKRGGLNGAAVATASVYISTAAMLTILFLKHTKSRFSDTLIVKISDFKYYRKLLGRVLGSLVKAA